MSTTVIRMACELTDGDEILSLCLPDDEGVTPVAVVVEKTTDQEDNTLLLIRVAPDTEVQTTARLREINEPAADFTADRRLIESTPVGVLPIDPGGAHKTGEDIR